LGNGTSETAEEQLERAGGGCKRGGDGSRHLGLKVGGLFLTDNKPTERKNPSYNLWALETPGAGKVVACRGGEHTRGKIKCFSGPTEKEKGKRKGGKTLYYALSRSTEAQT